jgi:hypothetical protein
MDLFGIWLLILFVYGVYLGIQGIQTASQKRNHLRQIRIDSFARCGSDHSIENYPIKFRVVPGENYEAQLTVTSPIIDETLTFNLYENEIVSKLTGIKYQFEDFNQLKFILKDDTEPRVVQLSSEFCPRDCKTTSV